MYMFKHMFKCIFYFFRPRFCESIKPVALFVATVIFASPHCMENSAFTRLFLKGCASIHSMVPPFIPPSAPRSFNALTLENISNQSCAEKLRMPIFLPGGVFHFVPSCARASLYPLTHVLRVNACVRKCVYICVPTRVGKFTQTYEPIHTYKLV